MLTRKKLLTKPIQTASHVTTKLHDRNVFESEIHGEEYTEIHFVDATPPVYGP